jgi:hypothetical protein
MAGRISYFGGIVTNGLILDLDAAKRDSYPGNGTTWRDISGNGNNGTLTNGPTFDAGNGGSIVFDGVNDLVNTSSNFLTPVAGTLCFWIKSNFVNDIYNTHSGSWNQITLWGASGLLNFRISNGTPGPGDVTISSSIVFDNIFHFVCTTWAVGGERAIWVDGTKRASLTNTLQFVPSATFEIGYKSWSPSYYNGRMCNILSYNRALSSTEILQNYNATKGRYGL